MNCFLCLEINNNVSNGIPINSPTWDEQHIQSIVEKHLWPMTIFVTEPRWLCMTCWEELSGFHKFYKSIEDVHLNSKCLLNSTSHCLPMPDEKLFEPEIEQDLSVIEIKQEKDDSDDFDNGGSSEHIRKCIDLNSIEDPLNKINRTRKTKTECINLYNTENSNPLSIEEQGTNEIKNEKDDLDTEDSLLMPPSDSKNKSEHKTYYQHKTSRREQDKFISQHFKLKCTICQEPFEKFAILLTHFGNVHKERGYVKCCETKFYVRCMLVDHINYHLDPEYFKCKLCCKVLTQRKSLVNHMKIHEEKQFGCDLCGKKFLVKFKLDQHKLTHMSQEDRKFQCKECDKLYASEAMLTHHQNVTHLNKYRKLCNICGLSMSDLNTFKIHMKKHEGIQPTTYSCDVCGLILAGKRHLKVHMESQHPEGGKKEYTCHICSKISPTLRAHKKHIHCAHEMGYDYKCTLCGKAFKRPENLKAHMATHTGNDLYSCPWCPKTFKSNGNMHNHRKIVHPKEWEEERRKRYSGKLPPSLKPPSTTSNVNNDLMDTDAY